MREGNSLHRAVARPRTTKPKDAGSSLDANKAAILENKAAIIANKAGIDALKWMVGVNMAITLALFAVVLAG